MAGIDDKGEWSKIGQFYIDDVAESPQRGELHYHTVDGTRLNVAEESDNQAILGEAT